MIILVIKPTDSVPMKHLIDKIARRYALSRQIRLDALRNNAINLQEQTFKHQLFKLSKARYLKDRGINSKSSLKDFRQRLPLTSYEDLFPFIQRMMLGERNVLVPGQVKWYSKSSGTTGSKSKLIPVTKNYMRTGFTRTNWDVVTILNEQDPEIGVFKYKTLLMGGTIKPYVENPKVRIGDVSAIMMENMPRFAKSFNTPSFEIALMDDWDAKLELMKTICSEESVLTFGGVPTWLLVLFRMMLDYKKVETITEIWPDARVFLHGGVGFDPYKEEFQKLFTREDFIYMEVYNASEGYFGLQDRFDEEGMLLLTDNSVFFEFIPKSEIESEQPIVLDLSEVETDVDYSLVISTSSGLWRYKIGDVIRFTSTHPYRFKVVGRTQQYINTFGEELMIHNTDKAIKICCDQFACSVANYTAGPIYFSDKNEKPGHQWLIEFDRHPDDLNKFAEALDKTLQSLNGDYESKRYNSIALDQLKIIPIPAGSFNSWLRANSKWGAQVKVPRLSNDRQIIDDILRHLSIQI